MEKEVLVSNKKEFIVSLKKLPFSQLILLCQKNLIFNDEESLEMINGVVSKILCERQMNVYLNSDEILFNYDYFTDNNLIKYDIDAFKMAIDEGRELTFLYYDSPQSLFNYFFSFIFSGQYEESMFSELVLSKKFQSFIKLELVNIENRIKKIENYSHHDINSIDTLLAVKRVFVNMLNVEYNDVYGYLSDIHPYYFRNLKRINAFINSELNKLKPIIVNYENMIIGGKFDVDYENENIYKYVNNYVEKKDCNNTGTCKIIYLSKIKKKV